MRLTALMLSLALVRCTTHEATRTVASARDDPRTAVAEWSQVHRFHCARGADGAVIQCTADTDCRDGRVCDQSVGCGCCVPPPARPDDGTTLRRFMFTACVEGRCAPPRFCVPSSDGRSCEMRFDREVPLWMTTYRAREGAEALVDVRRALCVRVEAGQQCLWTMDVPGGTYVADAPMPTRYEGSYECGGRTCNGHDAVRASPRVGASYTARLSVDGCGG